MALLMVCSATDTEACLLVASVLLAGMGYMRRASPTAYSA